MKRIVIVLFLFLFSFASAGFGQTGNPASALKWRQDLHYLATELARLHKNAFSVTSKPAFDKAVTTLDSRLDSLSNDEIVVEISKIVALIGDAHTTLNLFQPSLQFHYFPLGLIWLKDGYYVIGTTSENKMLLGAKLLKINGTDTGAVIKEVGRLISHENDFKVREMAPYYMASAEILQGLHIIRNAGETVFEFQTANGTLMNQSLKPLALTDNPDWQTSPDFSLTPQPLYLKNPERFYWYRYLADSQDIYFQYNSCREIPQQSFTRFSKELLETAGKYPVRHLIIDLRFNSGGNAALLDPFIAELKKRPVISLRGHLYVIIGRNTFDAAIIDALKLKNEANAILIGEPTGGKPNYFGEVKSFSLPNSGLVINYSTKYYNNSKEDSPSLLPDISAEAGPEDYFSGKDPVMQSIMSLENR